MELAGVQNVTGAYDGTPESQMIQIPATQIANNDSATQNVAASPSLKSNERLTELMLRIDVPEVTAQPDGWATFSFTDALKRRGTALEAVKAAQEIHVTYRAMSGPLEKHEAPVLDRWTLTMSKTLSLYIEVRYRLSFSHLVARKSDGKLRPTFMRFVPPPNAALAVPDSWEEIDTEPVPAPPSVMTPEVTLKFQPPTVQKTSGKQPAPTVQKTSGKQPAPKVPKKAQNALKPLVRAPPTQPSGKSESAETAPKPGKPPVDDVKAKPCITSLLKDVFKLPNNFQPIAKLSEMNTKKQRPRILSFTPVILDNKLDQAQFLNTHDPGQVWFYKPGLNRWGHISEMTKQLDCAMYAVLDIGPVGDVGWIVDVGGSVYEHHELGHSNTWTIQPNLTYVPRDANREARSHNLPLRCQHTAQTCVCLNDLRATGVQALTFRHSIYFFTPNELVEMMLSAGTAVAHSIEWDTTSMLPEYDGVLTCSYYDAQAHMTSGGDEYLDCRIESLPAGNLNPYLQWAGLWRTRNQLVFAEGWVLSWSSVRSFGKIHLVSYHLTQQENPITVPLPSQPTPSYSTTSRIDLRGPTGSGVAPTDTNRYASNVDAFCYQGTAPSSSYVLFTDLVSSTKSLVIMPRSIVATAAFRMALKTRDWNAIEMHCEHVKAQLRRYNCSPEFLQSIVSVLTLWSAVKGVRNDAHVTAAIGIDSENDRRDFEDAKIGWQGGYGLVNHMLRWATGGRVSWVSPRQQRLLVGCAVAIVAVTSPLWAPLLIPVISRSFGFTLRRSVSGFARSALGLAVPRVAKYGGSGLVGCVALALAGKAYVGIRESVMHRVAVKVAGTLQYHELEWEQLNDGQSLVHHDLRYRVSSCMEGLPVRARHPSIRVTVKQDTPCEHSFGIVQVGFGLNGWRPQCVRTCSHNVLIALESRLLGCTAVGINRDQSLPYPGITRDWTPVFGVMRAYFPRTGSFRYDGSKLSPLDAGLLKSWCERDIPPLKLKRWLTGYKDWIGSGFNAYDHRTQMMLKKECLVKVTVINDAIKETMYKCRCIFIFNDKFNGTYLPWIWNAAKVMASEWNGLPHPSNPTRRLLYPIGMDLANIGIMVQEFLSERKNVFWCFSDSEGADLHFQTPAMSLTLEYLDMVGMPRHLVKTLALSHQAGGRHNKLPITYDSAKKQGTRNGDRFSFPTIECPMDVCSMCTSPDGTIVGIPDDTNRLMTGVGHTGFGQTCVHGHCYLAWFDSICPLNEMFMSQLGDDNFTGIETEDDPTVGMREWFASIGFTIKVKVSRNLWEADFCSMWFVSSSTGLRLSPKIGRALSKTYYCWRPLSPTQYYDWLLTVATGLHNLVNHMPVLRVVNRLTIEFCHRQSARFRADYFEGHKWIAESGAQATHETFVETGLRYGCTPTDLEALEEWIKLNVHSFPCTASHWLLDKIANIDIGLGSVANAATELSAKETLIKSMSAFGLTTPSDFALEVLFMVIAEEIVKELADREIFGMSAFGYGEYWLYIGVALYYGAPPDAITGLILARLGPLWMHTVIMKLPFWQRCLFHGVWNFGMLAIAGIWSNK